MESDLSEGAEDRRRSGTGRASTRGAPSRRSTASSRTSSRPTAGSTTLAPRKITGSDISVLLSRRLQRVDRDSQPAPVVHVGGPEMSGPPRGRRESPSWNYRGVSSPCRSPPPGTTISAFPLIADNSSSFVSSNLLYRWRSLASMMSGPKEHTFSSSRAFYIRALQAVLPVSGPGRWCPAQAREHHNCFEAAFESVSYMVEPVSDDPVISECGIRRTEPRCRLNDPGRRFGHYLEAWNQAPREADCAS